jgi:hypothetical protein
MLYLAIKALVSGAIIAVVSEVAKRSPGLGAIILSLPLTALLAFKALVRYLRQGRHRHSGAIRLLVCAGYPTDVPAPALASA